MNAKKLIKMLSLNVGYYLWVILLLSIVTFLYDFKVAIAELSIFIILTIYYIITKSSTKNQMLDYVKSMILNVDTASKDTLINFPMPVVVLQLNGIISWYNEAFANLLGEKEIFEVSIREFVPKLNLDDFKKEDDNISCEITHNDRYYHVFGNIIGVSENVDSYFIVLYWDDKTDLVNIKNKYVDEKFVCGIILIDNYEDLMHDTPNTDRLKLAASIEEELDNFSSSANGILHKYEKDRFYFYYEKKYLDLFIKNNFPILQTVKDIHVGNKISPTLSIGIGCGGSSIAENDIFSKSALDMALGRGGDQVVIKDNDQFKFYGGKSREVEKRTRVKARVIAYAILELISNSDEILIMGHKNADIDVLGSALGLRRAILNSGKDAYILLDTYNQTVRRMIDKLDDSYNNVFISKSYTNDIVDKKTLIFVLDTHKHSLVEDDSLLQIAEKIVIIDHHRRSADFIENATITYHEPYASSTSELIIEVIQYMNDPVNLNKFETEALYSGIFLDTKNFTFKTGVRTFEAASFLKRVGVDTISVKKLFQTDLDTMMKKLSIIENSTTYKENFTISVCKKNDADMHTIVAQAADELLDILNIKASFVICDMNDQIIISARSLGDVNVQMILEKFNGGGHMTIAGAQIKDSSIEKILNELKESIDEYIKNQ